MRAPLYPQTAKNQTYPLYPLYLTSRPTKRRPARRTSVLLIADHVTANRPRKPRKPAAAPHPVLLAIPVKPRILKFLRKHLGAAYVVTSDDSYGIVLKEHMRSRPQKIERNKGLHRYTSVFSATATSRDFKCPQHLELTSLSIVRFNKFAERICAMEFHTMADICIQDAGLSIEQAIEKFRTKFGLSEDDWAAMTMRRSYLRYCNNPTDQPELERPPVRNYFPRKQDGDGDAIAQ